MDDGDEVEAGASFASIQDYEARYGEADVSDETLQVLLKDASNFIFTQPGFYLDPEGSPMYGFQQRTLTRVVCAIVHRILATSPDLAGFSSYTQSAGDYSATVQLSNPSGDMYLTAAEKRSLGISTGKIGQTL